MVGMRYAGGVIKPFAWSLSVEAKAIFQDTHACVPRWTGSSSQSNQPNDASEDMSHVEAWLNSRPTLEDVKQEHRQRWNNGLP
jgi:hypothetical protein